ncbi:MAG: right-handed parallel beta-helix repeat-containing protein [Eubacterium sp.]|nr:right-handed parallel beta-helix repeat-containing protein [Eubacterium sp.]
MKKRIIAVLFSLLIVLSVSLPFMVFAVSPITVSDGSEIYVYPINGSDITQSLKNAFSFCSEFDDKTFTVTVPQGEYIVSSPLTISDNTTLDLSANVVLANSESNTNIFISKRNVYGYNGSKNITVLGGFITYSEKYSSNSCLVRLGHAKNITFLNTVFEKNNNSHLVELAACNNIKFEGCTFKDSNGSLSNTSGEALQIDILEESTHFPKMPEYDSTMNNGITVNKCSFSNLLRGVGTGSGFAGLYQKGIKITNCKFNNIRSTAINCMNYAQSEISSNIITNCGEGIRYYMMMNDSNLGKMSYISGEGSPISDCKTKISNNNISVKRTADVSKAVGMYVFGNNITESKNAPFKKGNYCVGNISITNNIVKTQDIGIRLYDVNNSLVSGNEISGNTNEFGVFLNSNYKTNEISKNKIKNFKNGIYIKNGNSNKIKTNTLEANSNGVLFAEGVSAKIYKNTYKSNIKNDCYSFGDKKSYSFTNLSKPKITVSKSGKTATVKWKKIKNAEKYQIFRSKTQSGTYTRIATVSSKKLSYKDKKLKKGTYYYKVRAKRAYNSVTLYSSSSTPLKCKIK